MELYFIHSSFSSAKNAKEKEAAAMLRMYSDNLVSLPQLDSIIQELEFRINQLNENNKRARTLSVRLSNSITDGHRYICVENGTGSSVASIQVWKVANERY